MPTRTTLLAAALIQLAFAAAIAGQERDATRADKLEVMKVLKPTEAGFLTGLEYSADGKSLFAVDVSGTLWSWDSNSWKSSRLASLKVPSGFSLAAASGIAVSPDGQFVAIEQAVRGGLGPKVVVFHCRRALR